MLHGHILNLVLLPYQFCKKFRRKYDQVSILQAHTTLDLDFFYFYFFHVHPPDTISLRGKVIHFNHLAITGQ